MKAKFLCFVLLAVVAASVSAQATAGFGALSAPAQSILKMFQAGVDEPVILTYIQTESQPFALSGSEVENLKALGLSTKVLSAMIAKDAQLHPALLSSASAVPEAQLFRLHGQLIAYDNKLFPAQSQLDPAIDAVLKSDAAAYKDILNFKTGEGTSKAMFWGGLALVVGGPVYGAIAEGSGLLNDQANASIVAGSLGLGLVSWIVSGLVLHASYLDLYNGLSQYNSDLIHGGIGR